MAHHGDSPFDGEKPSPLKVDEIFRDALRQKHLRDALGPTGHYPQGKLTPHDEGEIALAVGRRNGKVILEFGKPIAWIGMDPTQAADLAETLLQHAARLGHIRPVRIKV